MKRCYQDAVVLTVVVVAVVVGYVILSNYVDVLSALKHETSHWAVIQDISGDRMAVEPSDDGVWSALVQLNINKTRMFVGGIVERYGNKWGFRFTPDSVRVAQFTAEGLQATLKMISADLDYWMNLQWAYVSSEVVEVHS